MGKARAPPLAHLPVTPRGTPAPSLRLRAAFDPPSLILTAPRLQGGLGWGLESTLTSSQVTSVPQAQPPHLENCWAQPGSGLLEAPGWLGSASTEPFPLRVAGLKEAGNLRDPPGRGWSFLSPGDRTSLTIAAIVGTVLSQARVCRLWVSPRPAPPTRKQRL